MVQARTFLERVVEESGVAHDSRSSSFLIRAIYGEYCCSTIFFLCVFAAIGNTHESGYDSFQSTLIVSLTAAFGAIAVIYMYSDVSGANFNMAISLALWITGKLSNRKLFLYWLVQIFGSVTAMALLTLVFDPSDSYFVAFQLDGGNLSTQQLLRAFAKEFIATFILTYSVFHVAFEDAQTEKKSIKTSTVAGTDTGVGSGTGITVYTTSPSSKGAFTPFVFGFLLFALLNLGGAAMNPLRIIAPAIVSFAAKADSGCGWDSSWIYVIGELGGAAAGGIVVHFIERLHTVSSRVAGAGEGDDGESISFLKSPLLLS